MSQLAITDAIHAITRYYQTEYDLTPYDTNCGSCEEFAQDVIEHLGLEEGDEIAACWHDEMPDCTAEEAWYWSHKFILYQGKYYDSECPEGVTEWRELPCFRNHPVPKPEVSHGNS